jgi:hypothetical protein
VLRLVRSSLIVRRQRHLITALSVALAVAFLVGVVGEAAATRAVALENGLERQAADRTQALRAAAVAPRRETAWLRLLERDPVALREWTLALAEPGDKAGWTAAFAALPAEAPRRGRALLRWLGDLSSARAWLIARTDRYEDWVLALDAPGRREKLTETLRNAPGLRLPLERAELDAFIADLPHLRAVLVVCAAAETVRMRRIAVLGGAAACADRLERGTQVPDDPLLPVTQVVSGWNPAELPLVQEQLRLDRLRQAAQDVLAQQARRDPALIDDRAVGDWSGMLRALTDAVERRSPAAQVVLAHDAAGALREDRLAAARGGDMAARQAVLAVLNATLDDAALSAADRWTGFTLPAEVMRLMGQDAATFPPRVRSHLNRLLLGAAFPGIDRPLATVASELDRIDDPTAEGEAARVALKAAMGADDTAAVVAEQSRRERRAELASAFVARGGDPRRPDARRLSLVGLSLLVCAVGVLNALVMAIHERFREIATMKCLGAQNGFIVRAVLWEAAAVGGAGALPGALLGLVAVVVQASSRYGDTFWVAIPIGQLALVALAGIVTGVGLALAGAALPARIAARMQPVQALRVDA